MGKAWTVLTQLHSLAGPGLTLIYPLYASVLAIEATSKLDSEQWLAYWIIHTFLTLLEMVLEPILEWIPMWYDVKLVFVAWLVLPQLRGASFLYEKYVRHHVLGRIGGNEHRQSNAAPTSMLLHRPGKRRSLHTLNHHHSRT
ncbi:hypothetical protein M0R45_037725 [Rubus argutus]|uniref:HVA22-like protein n=1 Tax=Rubus argutus TaxID=59490 RepID=A0AAW1W3H3_RUBAR